MSGDVMPLHGAFIARFVGDQRGYPVTRDDASLFFHHAAKGPFWIRSSIWEGGPDHIPVMLNLAECYVIEEHPE